MSRQAFIPGERWNGKKLAGAKFVMLGVSCASEIHVFRYSWSNVCFVMTQICQYFLGKCLASCVAPLQSVAVNLKTSLALFVQSK